MLKYDAPIFKPKYFRTSFNDYKIKYVSGRAENFRKVSPEQVKNKSSGVLEYRAQYLSLNVFGLASTIIK